MAEENPVQRRARIQQMMRSNPPGSSRGPSTPLGSSATFGGPGVDPQLMNAQVEHAADAPPEPTESQRMVKGAEIAFSTIGSAYPGGFLARRFGSGMATKLGKIGAEIVGRGIGAAGGGVLGSEWFTPKDVEDEADRMLRLQVAAGESFAGEALGVAAQPLGRAILLPVRRKFGAVTVREGVEELAPEAQAMLRSSDIKGATLTPGEMRKGRLLDTAENILEASFLGQEPFRVVRERAGEASIRAYMDAIPRFTANLDRQATGQLLDDMLSGAVRADRLATRAAYSALDQRLAASSIGRSEVINLHPVYNHFERQLREIAEAGDPYARRILRLLRVGARTEHLPAPAVGSLTPAGQAASGQVINRLTGFRQAEAIRSYLLQLSRQTTGDALPNVRAIAGAAAQEVDAAMEAGAQSLGSVGRDIRDFAMEARSLSRQAHETFDDPMIAALMQKQTPEEMSALLFKGDSPTRVRRLKQVLFSPRFEQVLGGKAQRLDSWRRIQSGWIRDQLVRSGGAEVGASGAKLVAQLRKAGGTANELFNPKELHSLRVAAKALELSQAGAKASRSGAIFMQLTQASAVAAFLKWGDAKTTQDELLGSAGIIFGPSALALAFTSPRFASWMLSRALSKGSRIGRGTSDLAAQAISHLVKDQIPFTYRDENGKETSWDPSMGGLAEGRGGKPMSKYNQGQEEK